MKLIVEGKELVAIHFNKIGGIDREALCFYGSSSPLLTEINIANVFNRRVTSWLCDLFLLNIGKAC